MPDGTDEKLWQATVAILSRHQNGEECSPGPRHLPSGRYRVSVRVFDTAAEASAAVGGRLFQHDFELVGGQAPQLVEIPVSLEVPTDAGADGP